MNARVSHVAAITLAILLVGAAGCAASVAHPSETTAAPTYTVLVSRAQSSFSRNRFEQAADAAAHAVQLEPTRPEAHGIRGRALLRLNDIERAIDALEHARRLGSTDRDVYAELASTYDISKRLPQAADVYAEYLQRHPNDGDMLQQYGLTLLMLGKGDEAIDKLQRAASLQSGNAQVALDLAYAVMQKGRAAEAVKILKPVVANTPDNSQARDLLDAAYAKHIGMLIDAQHLDDATGVLQEANSPSKAWWQLRRAQIMWRKRERQGLTELQALAKSHPKSTEVWRELALAAEAFGEVAMARQAREKLHAIERNELR